MHYVYLPLDSQSVVSDIADALSENLKTPNTHRTIIQHHKYNETMNQLAGLICTHLARELESTCKELDIKPIVLSKASFDAKGRFFAECNANSETLGALVFTKFWHLQQVYNISNDDPIGYSFEYFWMYLFDNNDTFRSVVLSLFSPLVSHTVEQTVSVTYEMFFKNKNTFDVPKSVIDQGRQAVIDYISQKALSDKIDLTANEFYHDLVRCETDDETHPII